MIWLIVYGVLALLTFTVLTILATISVKEENSIFKFPVYHVQIGKLIVMSLFFPFVWIAIIISAIVNR